MQQKAKKTNQHTHLSRSESEINLPEKTLQNQPPTNCHLLKSFSLPVFPDFFSRSLAFTLYFLSPACECVCVCVCVCMRVGKFNPVSGKVLQLNHVHAPTRLRVNRKRTEQVVTAVVIFHISNHSNKISAVCWWR